MTTTSSPSLPVEYGSTIFVASYTLLAALRKEWKLVPKPGVWAYAVLTQGFCIPGDIAIDMLEARCTTEVTPQARFLVRLPLTR